jgi:hypothetical protein
MEYVKIQSNASLVRDMTSNAIINTNKEEYLNYINRVSRQTSLNETISNTTEQIEVLKTEINSMKEDLSDIKIMLLSLIDKGK